MAEMVQFRVVAGAVFQETLKKTHDEADWRIDSRAVCMTDGVRFRAILPQVSVHPKKKYRNATLAEVRQHFIDAAKAGDDKMTDEIAGRKFDNLVVH